MSYSHLTHSSKRATPHSILTLEQVRRAHAMRERGMTWAAIAAWFTRNERPVSYQAVRDSCARLAA